MERSPADPDRVRAAVALLATHERAFRRTARRWSLCADDADDAFQRAAEILLTRAPALGRDRLVGWMQVVTRHEALAVRRERDRLLASPGRDRGFGPDAVDRLDRLISPRPGPDEEAERRERFVAGARLLGELKPQERLAIVLQACGYSYTEIAAGCEWTYTKVNRCLAEGRERLRELDRGGSPAG